MWNWYDILEPSEINQAWDHFETLSKPIRSRLHRLRLNVSPWHRLAKTQPDYEVTSDPESLFGQFNALANFVRNDCETIIRQINTEIGLPEASPHDLTAGADLIPSNHQTLSYRTTKRSDFQSTLLALRCPFPDGSERVHCRLKPVSGG
jgi:hypothetical protein